MNQTRTTTVDITLITRIHHEEAMKITAVENRKFGDMLRSLSPEQWSTQTECTLWDVRSMAAHLVGSAASQTSTARSSERFCSGMRDRCRAR